MQFFTRTKIVVKYSVSDFSLNKGKDKWAIKTSSAIKGDIVKAYNDDGLTRLPMDILDAVMLKDKHMNTLMKKYSCLTRKYSNNFSRQIK